MSHHFHDEIGDSSTSRSNKRKRIFEKNQDHKSGKWSTDEEKYARWLVEEFQKGTLRDCESGSTLRSYLARKLACSPMRVSKKFAGLRIGKLVYVPMFPLSCESPTTSCTSLESSGTDSDCSVTTDEFLDVETPPTELNKSEIPMNGLVSESYNKTIFDILANLSPSYGDACPGADLSNTFGRLTADVPPLVCDALYGVDVFADCDEEDKSTAFPWYCPQVDPMGEADEWVLVLSSFQNEEVSPEET